MKVPRIPRISSSPSAAPALEMAPKGEQIQVIKTHASYMRGNVGPVMSSWRPALRDTQDDVSSSWNDAAARATDVLQNSGWISGGVESACGSVLGTGLRLVARPDTTLVKFNGLKDDSGKDIDSDGWARFVERRWHAYASNPLECDAVARQTISQMARAALKMWFATGEIVALLPYHKDSLAITGTKVLLLPSWKLSLKNDPLNKVVQGVRMDGRGRPAGYVFRMKNALNMETDVSILARDAVNRPQVIHIYDGLPGQIRGITPFVSALKVVRQADQLANATLTAALIQSLFAATVESDLPTSEVMQALQSGDEQQGIGGGTLEDFLAARLGWAQNTRIDLSDQSKIAHLFPGEKLKFNRSEHPNTVYEAFMNILLREIAKALGITFEQLTGNYNGVSYTGVRMSTTDNWPNVMHRRDNIMARFYQPIYEAWLEEEIETGRVKFPGGIAAFMELRSAACRAYWRGPAKPQADDLKTAKTHQIYREMGVLSDTDIAEDLGVRIEDSYESREREAKLREKFGLEDMGPSIQTEAAKIAREPDPEDNEDETPPTPAVVR